MNGRVLANHALIKIPLQLVGMPVLEIEFVIDTGFMGFLTLPLAAVARLDLPFIRRIPANLADDSMIMVDVYVATIVWNNIEREVEVLATGKRPLLGTLMLHGHVLSVLFTDGGAVTIGDL